MLTNSACLIVEHWRMGAIVTNYDSSYCMANHNGEIATYRTALSGELHLHWVMSDFRRIRELSDEFDKSLCARHFALSRSETKRTRGSCNSEFDGAQWLSELQPIITIDSFTWTLRSVCGDSLGKNSNFGRDHERRSSLGVLIQCLWPVCQKLMVLPNLVLGTCYPERRSVKFLFVVVAYDTGNVYNRDVWNVNSNSLVTEDVNCDRLWYWGLPVFYVLRCSSKLMGFMTVCDDPLLQPRSMIDLFDL
jgi:hypothetical protein